MSRIALLQPGAMGVTVGAALRASGHQVCFPANGRSAATLERAGLANFQEAPGWRSIPLERLAFEQPELVAAAFFDPGAVDTFPWSAARHPLARRQLIEHPVVSLDGAWTACGGWFVLDAVEALAAEPPASP